MPNSLTSKTPPIVGNNHNIALMVSDQDSDLARANRATGVPTNNHISDHIQPQNLDQELPFIAGHPDNTAQPLSQQQSGSRTAVIFLDDKPQGGKVQSGRKVNYYTSILRQIEQIDKNYVKEQKLRKQGLKSEALEIVNQAVNAQPAQAPSPEQSDARLSSAMILKESEQDADQDEGRMSNLLRKSLGNAIEMRLK